MTVVLERFSYLVTKFLKKKYEKDFYHFVQFCQNIVKAAVYYFYNNIFFAYLLKLSLCSDSLV